MSNRLLFELVDKPVLHQIHLQRHNLLSPPSPPNSPVLTSSQPTSSIASPPTLAPQDDDDDRPLAQLHRVNSPIPLTFITNITFANIIANLHLKLFVVFLHDYNSLFAFYLHQSHQIILQHPASPLVPPSQPPRLPPDPHTASALADTLT